MSSSDTPHPTDIRLRRRSRVLGVTFSDGQHFDLPLEYLRVHSPSAEVRGHGPGQETLVTGKEDVNVERVEPVGNYAVRLVFDDGHATGLYSWRILYDLGRNHQQLWPAYLKRLKEAGYTRRSETSEH